MNKSRFAPTRRALIFWTLFIGIGAVGGAVGMLTDPTGRAMGMDGMLPYFQKLPFSDVLFQNLTFSGIALLIVNGITNLIAAALLLLKRKSGVILGGIFGVTLMLWICIQFYMFPPNFMSTTYFIFGAIQAATGYMAWVFYMQEHFKIPEQCYTSIGSSPKNLVVYFSRMGYTKKLALERAADTGATVYEIKAAERTWGTLGFWWCGRYGMHRWEMPIEKPDVDISQFEHVTICSPVWVFHLAPPVKSFCRWASGKIHSADYILVHHQKNPYWGACREMDEILGLENTPSVSVCCREGRYKRVLTRNNAGATVS